MPGEFAIVAHREFLELPDMRMSLDALVRGDAMFHLGLGHMVRDWLSCMRLVIAGRTVTPAAVSVSANLH